MHGRKTGTHLTIELGRDVHNGKAQNHSHESGQARERVDLSIERIGQKHQHGKGETLQAPMYYGPISSICRGDGLE